MSKITIRHNIRENFTMVTNDFARDPHVTPRAAKVYLYLMSHSEGWETSAARIHKVLGMGLTTVKEALKDLEKLGYLQRVQERNPDGTMSGSSYDLFSEPQTVERKATHGATSGNDANVQVSTGVWKTDDGFTDDGKATPIRRTSFKKNNLQEEQDKTPLTPKGELVDVQELFTHWYSSYPRKQSRGDAEKAFKAAIKKTDMDTLIAGLKASIAQWGREQRPLEKVPYPASWLRAESWLDEIPSPVTATASSTGTDWATMALDLNLASEEADNEIPF